MSDDEFCETEALRGHINCGGVKLNLDKLTFSLSCIYCDLEMLSIREFGYHFQEHLVMSKTENETLLKNLDENLRDNSLFIEEVPPRIPRKTKESKEKLAEYEIEMLDDTTEDHVEIPTTNTENSEEHQYVYQVMDNEIATEFNKTTKRLNNMSGAQEQLYQQETVDIGFDLVSDEAAAVAIAKQNDSFTCDVCDFKFADVATLRKHRQHHNRCQICKKCFLSKALLNEHLRTHKKKPTYDCGECGEIFATSNDLTAHQGTHVQKPLHLCSTCGKSFQDERLLRQHIKTHTTRPFVCIECNMTFSKSAALMLHTKLHSDVKKFSCSICRMTFAQNSGLSNHLKEKHSNTTTAANEA